MFPNPIIQGVNNCCDGYDSDDYGITLVLCIALRYAKELKKIDGKMVTLVTQSKTSFTG